VMVKLTQSIHDLTLRGGGGGGRSGHPNCDDTGARAASYIIHGHSNVHIPPANWIYNLLDSGPMNFRGLWAQRFGARPLTAIGVDAGRAEHSPMALHTSPPNHHHYQIPLETF
jgi:hypothetical protein